MKMPKKPKNATLKSMKNYIEKINDYKEVKTLEKKAQDIKAKIK